MGDAKTEAAPKDVATTKATEATKCRGRWSQCDGKFQQVSESWHICNACTADRERLMKAGKTMRGGVIVDADAKPAPARAPEPKGLSAKQAGKTKEEPKAETAEAPTEERNHKPPRSVLSQPVTRVAGTANAATAQLLKPR